MLIQIVFFIKMIFLAALKIAIEAKLKKKLMYEAEPEEY